MMRIYIFIIFALLLSSCTNNYSEDNTNDSSTAKKNNENNIFLNEKSEDLLFNKVNPTVYYDDNLNKIFIKYQETSVEINLVDYDSYLTLSMKDKILNKKFNSDFDYTYSEDLDSAVSKIRFFTAENIKMQILMLPSTTEEFPTYTTLTLGKNGFLKSYTIEIRDSNCSDIENIILDDTTNSILIKTKTGKVCETHIVDKKSIQEKPQLLSSIDIFKMHPKGTYDIYNFDVNADDIKDKIVAKINDNSNLFQGNELYIYLGDKSQKYKLSLKTNSFTDDGGFFLAEILPRPSNNGFSLSTYFSSKGFPFKDYYYVLKNNEWYINSVATKGYLVHGEEYYCIDTQEFSLHGLDGRISNLDKNDNEISQDCPPAPIKYVVKTKQTEILNEKFESRSPSNYYIKGDKIEAFDQNEDWVKVSYKNGTKFGWIDKSDLTPISD